MSPEDPERTDQTVPLSPAGGSSASGNGHNVDMEDRVAFYKRQLAEALTDAYEEPVIPDLEDLIKAADAKHERLERSRVKIPNAAPVRRKGPSPKKVGAIGGIDIVEDPNAPPGGIAVPRPEKKPRKKVPQRAPIIPDISDERLLAEAGIEMFYSSKEAAEFFDRTTQWIYWGLGKSGADPVFVHPDGTPIVPQRVGTGPNAPRRFTLDDIRDILKACHRRGNVEPDELKKILRRIRVADLGGEWRQREGWHKIGKKWIHPDDCVKVHGVWKKKKKDISE